LCADVTALPPAALWLLALALIVLGLRPRRTRAAILTG